MAMSHCRWTEQVHQRQRKGAISGIQCNLSSITRTAPCIASMQDAALLRMVSSSTAAKTIETIRCSLRTRSIRRVRISSLSSACLDANKLKVRVTRSVSHCLLTAVGSLLTHLQAWKITNMERCCHRSCHKHEPKHRHRSLLLWVCTSLTLFCQTISHPV